MTEQLTDETFNEHCRTEFYESGKLPEPVSFVHIRLINHMAVRTCVGDWGRDAIQACINERHLREWLREKWIFITNIVGIPMATKLEDSGLIDMPLTKDGFVEVRDVVDILTFKSDCEAILAAVRAVLKEKT